MVGIKGTGMCALAELLTSSGVKVTGSDRAEKFYTDEILTSLGIPYFESFDPAHIPGGTDLVIYSAAYDPSANPELAAAAKRGIPMLKYTDALGAYSADYDSSGIAGVHGKTTTTAITGLLLKSLEIPARVLAGSSVGGFGSRSTLFMGDKYFVAETCEYRKHFLSFHPRRIILTSVESDHQDFFPDYESIRDAFLEYLRLLPDGGVLIFCADDPGAAECADTISRERTDIQLVPYGFSAAGDFRVVSLETIRERTELVLQGFPGSFRIKVPGKHIALDAAAALALADSLLKTETGSATPWTEARLSAVRDALEAFSGSRRRSEIIGEAGGILFMDDYGHHPTAIKTTLEGLKAFYPDRRLVVSFMSHTYTRTAALLDDFAESLGAADVAVLHKIYGSAREQYDGGITGRTLFEKTSALRDSVFYADEPGEALPLMRDILKPGDLFITMGAGDNWILGKAAYEYFSRKA
ncbi:UDP-N-acetylmuramate--L-alanine ligase [Breznakiella homolactica]|nr:UDP-N-acetylmuramate--L-alanine ligase [Breznakiella homolactica]